MAYNIYINPIYIIISGLSRSTGPAGGHGAADRVHRQGRDRLHAPGTHHGGHGSQSQQGLVGYAP